MTYTIDPEFDRYAECDHSTLQLNVKHPKPACNVHVVFIVCTRLAPAHTTHMICVECARLLLVIVGLMGVNRITRGENAPLIWVCGDSETSHFRRARTKLLINFRARMCSRVCVLIII